MSLSSDLRKFAKKAKLSTNQVYRLVMNDLSNAMITSSPVDQGTFQANWLAALNSGDYTFDKNKTNVSESSGRLTVTLGGLTTAKSFYFTNSSPYAQGLEDGYSEQAKHGMVKVAINDFPSYVALRAGQVR